MEKTVLKKELSALKAKVEDLQKLVAEEALTNQRPRAQKMTKKVATHWRESIINEVRENDGISREKLIRSVLPYAKKGKGQLSSSFGLKCTHSCQHKQCPLCFPTNSS